MHRAVDEVDLDVKEGQFIAILGHNGSGKSTLAKHIYAILVPTGGTMWVDGKDTKKPPSVPSVCTDFHYIFSGSGYSSPKVSTVTSSILSSLLCTRILRTLTELMQHSVKL